MLLEMDVPIFHETYGSGNVERDYLKTFAGNVRKKKSKESTVASFLIVLKTIFLPQGYPESVSEDYLIYQIWDTVQAFCSSITGTLATHAMLKGVGVGDETATAAAATITWLLKDGTGMAGRILFAWHSGTSLDNEAKSWRLFADILNDMAICLELVSPYFPGYFTLIACISGIMKSIVGVAGGATRAALTMHQAKRNNMADVSAKDGSQETLVNLAALIVGLIITPLIVENQSLTWLLFFIFTSLHIFANYKAVTCVVMETFNQARLSAVAHEYLDSHGDVMLTPKVANGREPVFFAFRRSKLKMGVSFQDFFQSTTIEEVMQAIDSSPNDRYLLRYNHKTGSVQVIFHMDSAAKDHLEAAFQAEIIFNAIYQEKSKLTNSFRDGQLQGYYQDLQKCLKTDYANTNQHQWSIERLSGKICQHYFHNFLSNAEVFGWTLSRTLLGLDEWRGKWNLQGLTEKKEF